MSFVYTYHLLPAACFSLFEIGIRCFQNSVIDAIIKSEAWWQNNILQGYKTFFWVEAPTYFLVSGIWLFLDGSSDPSCSYKFSHS